LDRSTIPLLTAAHIAPNGAFIEGGGRTIRSLKGLSLRGSSIGEVAPGAFAWVDGLRTLDLSGNMLTELPATTFTAAHGSTLVWLGLNGNKLSAVGPGTFAGLQALTALHLANNQLRAIGPQALHGLNLLTSLNLLNNGLEVIEAGLISVLPMLAMEFTTAEGNPLACVLAPETAAGLRCTCTGNWTVYDDHSTLAGTVFFIWALDRILRSRMVIRSHNVVWRHQCGDRVHG
jgi:Leucine-rich repeat (LRR) protein